MPKADEGAVLALKLIVFQSFHSPFVKTVHRSASTNTPSSASGTFSPTLKSAWGRRTLDELNVTPLRHRRYHSQRSTARDTIRV